MRLWGTITKVTDNEDGTLTVAGIASSEAVDSDGEVITAEAMRAAIPDYMKFGAVREMHQPIAAGTAMACEVQDDGRTHLEALVVDSESVKKVKAGVLKGFSIGGKVQKRNAKNKNIIEAIKLVEISLVDRPANPEAIIGLVKLEDTVEPTEKPAADQAPENAPVPEAEAAPEAEKSEALANLKKWAGEEVWDAQTALSALDALMFLLNRESAEPGEPAEQVQALLDAIAGIKRFIVSEIQEDSTGMAGGADDALAMGEGTGDLEKKGATFSAAVKQKLGAVHKMIQECDGAMKAIGYDQADDDGDEAGKAEHAEALAKAAGLEDELTKAHTERDEALAKAAGLAAEVEELKKGQEVLVNETNALLEQMKAKGQLRVIGKGEDLGDLAKASGTKEPETARDAIKAAHQSGGVLISR